MDSRMEHLTENENGNAGVGNGNAGVENDITGTESDFSGAENDVTGAENDVTGAENDVIGAENDIIDGGETLLAEADHTESLGGDEINTTGDDTNTPGAEDNMDETAKHTEIQQGHENDLGVKKSEKRWPGWPGESVFRILVPSQKVGGIIGRKGEFIKKMCEESKARIKILEAPSGAPERAVMVSAKEEQDASISPAMDGLLRIHKRVVDGLDGEANAPENAGSTVHTRLLVGASQAGTLIGKHGATIKSIQEASGCTVRVIDDAPPFALHDDKIVEIQGQPTAVHKALELVASHLRKFLVDRSVIPLFDSQMLRPIPEMHSNMPPPQPWGHHQGIPSSAGGGFGGNTQFMPPMPQDNFYRPHEMPPFEKPPHHGISTFGRDVPPMGGYPPSNQHGQQMQHMQVPLSYADAVIGAAGANISYIRRASGATITIQETAGIPGEMTVEINGSATQVQTAQQLVQNFMAEAGAPPAQNPAATPADPYASSYGPPYSSYSAPPVNAGHPASSSGGYGSSYGAGYGY